ncbi:MAG TPA: hypothetical protein VK961_00035 [Chthoniobacter sp.]|nr:hypothetical protein [Chthoniobacter sp.]
MTPSQLIVNHCLETMDLFPRERRIVLLRSLAVEISDQALATECREHAADLERAEASQRKLLLSTNTKRSVD